MVRETLGVISVGFAVLDVTAALSYSDWKQAAKQKTSLCLPCSVTAK